MLRVSLETDTLYRTDAASVRPVGDHWGDHFMRYVAPGSIWGLLWVGSTTTHRWLEPFYHG
jgi:hypothetical protein